VFITASSGPRQQRLHVLCFAAADGKLLWERQFAATGRTMCHEKTCVAAPTPASDGQRVFALFSSNDLVCLDLEGNLLWLRGLTLDYPNASNSLGLSSSLVVSGGVVVAQIENEGESFAVGVAADSGVNRWKLERPKKANWTSPVVLRDPSGRELVGLQSTAGFSAIEPATGRVVWQQALGASVIPSTAVGDGRIFVPSRGLSAIEIPAGDAAPKELWQNGQLRPGTASPLLLGDRLFTLNDAGVLTAGSAANGERLWQLRLKGPFSASPVTAGGWIYTVNEKGLIQVVDPTKPEGEVVSELALGETILGTPAIAGGALYVRSDGALWKFFDPQAAGR
jgi:outer membrane protein assembly factor BamB